MSFWRPFEKQIKEERTDEDYTEDSPECIVLKLQDMVQGITGGDFGSFACISPPASTTSPVHSSSEEPGLASGAHCMPTVQPTSLKCNAVFATYPAHSTCSGLISPSWIPQPDIVAPLESPGYYAQPEVCSSPMKRKQTRPFIAMTATIPVLPSGSSPPDVRYEAFRSAMFEAMSARNGGSLSVSNPRMRREVRGAAAAAAAGGAGYQARRARNNAAAKRSRDLRKLKEDELAIRAAFLEHANAELRRQVHAAATRLCTDCQSRF